VEAVVCDLDSRSLKVTTVPNPGSLEPGLPGGST